MRLAFAISILTAARWYPVEAFSVISPFVRGVPQSASESKSCSQSQERRSVALHDTDDAEGESTAPFDIPQIDPEQVKTKYAAELERLREKDKNSKDIKSEDLKVVYEDIHLVVVDKPSGVLCVPSQGADNPSLSKVVFDRFGCESGSMDKMVVHRLGMETSGLMVFARTNDALRGMNTLFRTRKVNRQYEALLCGHVKDDEGVIDMPLMRDFEYPPYMRVSTDALQHALIDVEPEDLGGKKLLELPKDSQTKYEVVAREEFEGHPVTRVSLTSITGRTHQLNVHCAAFGHPIVADTVYGINGAAATNGGLDDATMDSSAPDRASMELQQKIAKAAAGKSMCIHAKVISFEHPITREDLRFESAASF